MFDSGYVRIIDDFGRIGIPKPVRQKLGVTEGVRFKIVYEENGIISLIPYKDADE